MAKADQPEKGGFRKRLREIGQVFAFTMANDRWFLPLLIAAVVVAGGITALMAIFWGPLFIAGGVMLTLLAALIVFSTRTNSAIMKVAEGQRGSVAQIVERMRGDFRVKAAFASTTQMDMVHVVLCRGGVVLLGEGQPGRVKALVGQERKRLSKVIGSAEMRDFMIGNEEGQVPLRKIRMTLMRLPRTLSPKEVNALDKRITALSARPNLPKGAIPKELRPPKGAFRAMRGGPR
jgi:hypothetical protein